MNSVNSKGKLLRIAFFLHDMDGEYSELLLKGVENCAKKNNVNLFIFCGRSLKSIYENQIQHNIIYNLVKRKNIDGLVISSPTLFNFVNDNEVKKFLDNYKGLPIVSIGKTIENYPAVLINDTNGFKNAINHLIKYHGKKRIAFIQGVESNDDAKHRYKVYLDVLKENDIPFDPDLVIPGDFTRFAAINAVRVLVEENKVSFDALVAANDEMALYAMRALQERGFDIPNDIAVIGFDNVGFAASSKPTLTTVAQPVYQQAYFAMEKLIGIINGVNDNESMFLDTEMIIRESCGCLSEVLKSIRSNEYSKSDIKDECILNSKYITEFYNRIIGDKLPIYIKEEEFKNFLGKCFELFVENEPSSETKRVLLREFKESLKTELITSNDIIRIQGIITALRADVLNLIKKNRDFADDFFHLLRYWIMHIVNKKQASRWNSHHNNIILERNALNKMISKIHDKQILLDSIVFEMRSIGIRSCYIYLYEKEIYNSKNKSWKDPSELFLEMSYDDNSNLNFNKNKMIFNWENILSNNIYPSNRRWSFFVSPLYIGNEHLGIILSEFEHDDKFLLEYMLVEISSALKLATVLNNRRQIEQQLKDAMDKLESYNQMLSNLSQTDELTGLYNRRAFLNIARQSLEHAKNMNKSGYMFYADMDGLKQINDIYGHDEGDKAIKAVAEIFKKAFRWSDVIARMGGDEFTIFTVGSDKNTGTRIQKRIIDMLDKYNVEKCLPYKLSISLGYVYFHSNDSLTIEDLMITADNLLLKQKREKKKLRSK